MRPLFLALVFANLAFLGWVLLVGQPARDFAPPSRNPGLPSLKLAMEASTPTTVGAAPAAGPRCVTVGPFPVREDADRAQALLRSEHLAPRARTEVEAGGTPSEYVVIEREVSEAEAHRTATRLRTIGVEGVTSARDTEGRAVLSFGSYSSLAEAQARVVSLRRFGLKAAIDEHAARVPKTWLDVDLAAGDRPVDVTALQALIGSHDPLSLSSCPTPAGAPAPSAPSTARGSPTARPKAA